MPLLPLSSSLHPRPTVKGASQAGGPAGERALRRLLGVRMPHGGRMWVVAELGWGWRGGLPILQRGMFGLDSLVMGTL